VAAKTYQSALAVVPPEAVWEPIQVIRRRHDRQVHRWPPHINLLYPFLPRLDFSSAASRLIVACSAGRPFSVTLAAFRLFRHGSGPCTLWLAPEPAENLRQLQAALQAAFPDCDDLGRFPAGYTPHLSVGQVASVADCQRVREQLQAAWQPLVFLLTEVALLAREVDGPFCIEQRVPLGHGSQG
jgi:2'-5' RNA ligase